MTFNFTHFKVRFSLVVAVIALLGIFSFILFAKMNSARESSGAAINLSSRQGMLSVRVNLLAEQLLDAAKTGDSNIGRLKWDLNVTATEIDRGIESLTQGDPGAGLRGIHSEDLRSLYFDPDRPVVEELSHMAALAKEIAEMDASSIVKENAKLSELRHVSRNLVLHLDDISKWYEQDDAAVITNLQIVNGGILAVMLITLILMVWKVFRPLAQFVHQEEAELRKSRTRLRGTIDSALDAVITINQSGCIVEMNPSAENIFGYSISEAKGKPISDLIIPEKYRKRHREGLKRYLESGKSEVVGKRVEMTAMRSDGSDFPVEMTIEKICLDEEILFTAFLRDISETRKTEDRLRKLSRAVEQSPVSVIITDLNGEIEYVNPKFSEVTGYSAAEIIGKKPSILKSGHTSAEGYRDLWKTITTGREWRGELQNKKKSGELFWEFVSISSIKSANGEITNYLAVKEDITERKRADKALKKANETLEIRVEERTQRLLEEIEERRQAERNLLVARELAEKANRAKSEFLSSMSHELRTPMNAILGFSQLLLNNPKEDLSAQQKEYVELVLKSGDHLLTLIDDVLDLSKIEAGRVTLSIESISPHMVIDDCAAMIQTIAKRRGIKMNCRIGTDELPNILADYTRLRQALLNLLTNAVKYNRAGGSVTLICEKPTDGWLKFEVADTGPGIPLENQANLFKPFDRLGAEASEIEGTGIGLTITKRLIELMSGRIGFQSDPGRGSTFWLDVPIDMNGKTDRVKEVRVNKIKHRKANDTRTLLYIEDNPDNLKLMEQIITTIPNLTLLSAHNAELGLELAAAHHPDIVVMDVNLPGMSGIEAMKNLRQSDETKSIPVIALSALVKPDEIKKGITAGFDKYLVKPLVISEFVEAIENSMRSNANG